MQLKAQMFIFSASKFKAYRCVYVVDHKPFFLQINNAYRVSAADSANSRSLYFIVLNTINSHDRANHETGQVQSG